MNLSLVLVIVIGRMIFLYKVLQNILLLKVELIPCELTVIISFNSLLFFNEKVWKNTRLEQLGFYCRTTLEQSVPVVEGGGYLIHLRYRAQRNNMSRRAANNINRNINKTSLLGQELLPSLLLFSTRMFIFLSSSLWKKKHSAY